MRKQTKRKLIIFSIPLCRTVLNCYLLDSFYKLKFYMSFLGRSCRIIYFSKLLGITTITYKISSVGLKYLLNYIIEFSTLMFPVLFKLHLS